MPQNPKDQPLQTRQIRQIARDNGVQDYGKKGRAELSLNLQMKRPK